MEIILTTDYADIFPGEDESIVSLLKDIPSPLLIQLIAALNSELYIRDQGMPTQIKILDLLLKRQASDVKEEILTRVLSKVRKNEENTYFFSIMFNMNFLHYELTHFRDLPYEELSVDQELRVFKAYLRIAETTNDAYIKAMGTIPPYNNEYFRKTVWPTLIDQFELNKQLTPFPTLVRGAVFFNYLKNHSRYSKYAESYLQRHGKATALNYLFDIANLFVAGSNRSAEMSPDGLATFSTQSAPGFITLFEQFTLDREAYAKLYQNSKSNFSGIKSQPLYKLNDNNYLILHWGYLTNKMYEGLIFDFYQYSGIAEHHDFKAFTDFKRFLGESITERYLVRKLLTRMFNRKHQIVKFDEKEIKGFPDAYFRRGNDVFLFEIKDAYFPASAINGYSYEKIKAAIDQKMNNEAKGTGQFIKQLKSLTKQPFENPVGYKYLRNLNIYPVIIYADLIFEMPGVDQYLQDEFEAKVLANGLEKHYKKIKPLTFINLTFLIKNFDLLEEKGTRLSDLIEHYKSEIEKRKKRSERTRNLIDHMRVYTSFEQIVSDMLPHTNPKRNYLDTCIKVLDLKEGLPV
jgi:hypothetical protein